MELFEIELFIHIKMDLALNNLQRLICHKTQPTNQSSLPPPILLFDALLFYFIAKIIPIPNNLHPLHLISLQKIFKKFGHTSLSHYLWSLIILTGLEVDDHFTFNFYITKWSLHLNSKILGFFFFKISSLQIFFLAVYMY